MKAVTFYSYKGGVGRTLALSNLAKKLADYDKDVFVLDFDLEAPGLTYKLADQVKGTEALQKKGVVEYISYFQQHRRLPENFTEYYTELNVGNRTGKIYLMTAGLYQTEAYWEQLMGINWVKLFEPGGDGVPLMLDLKGRIDKVVKPDILLIDSRTGMTPAASITLKIMADQCVVMAVNNAENLDGVKMVLQTLTTMPENIRPEVNFVLTRIPYHDHNELVKDKEHTVLDEAKKNYLEGIDIAQFNYFGVIHHEPEMGWGESQRLGLPIENKDFLWYDYYNLFLRLFPSWASEAFQKEQEIARLIEKAANEENPEKQLEYLKSAIELKPKEADQLDFICFQLLDLRDFKLAIEISNYWINIIPEYSEPYFHKAHALFELFPNVYDETIHFYKKAIELPAKDPWDYQIACIASNNLGNIYLVKGDLDLAIEQYQNAIALNSKYAVAYFNLGNVFDAKAEYKLAIQQYQDSIRLKPDFAEAYVNWGITLSNLNSYTEAISKYKTAIEIKPSFTDAYFNCGLAFSKLEAYQEAIIQFQKAIDIKPDFFDAYYALGKVYESLVKHNEAIEQYKKATEIKHDYDIAYFQWGNVLYIQGEYSQAIEKYEKVIEINPNDEVAYFNLGNIYIDLERYQEAIEHYQKAIVLDPDYIEAYYNLGNALSSLKQYSKAILQYQKVINLKPDEAAAFVNITVSLIELFHQSQDQLYLQEAREKGLKSEELGGGVYNLACVYALLGETNLALEHLKLCLERKEITLAHVKTDNDWKAYHGTPAFEELLRAYEG